MSLMRKLALAALTLSTLVVSGCYVDDRRHGGYYHHGCYNCRRW